jgi:hypothetical protein
MVGFQNKDQKGMNISTRNKVSLVFSVTQNKYSITHTIIRSIITTTSFSCIFLFLKRKSAVIDRIKINIIIPD